MKRIFSITALCLFALLSVNAQENKPATVYVPEKGDLAIGVDLKPILKYVGNMFNGNTGNELENIGGEPVTNLLNEIEGVSPDVSIMGKYMLSDKWGLRANLGFMFRNNSNKSYVTDDEAKFLNSLDESKVVDVESRAKHGMSFMFGTEYRKGSKRVQGVFSAGVLMGFNSQKTSYKYGNKLTSINQTPSTAFPSTGAYRTISKESKSNFLYGITAGAGVEWFVAPKIALGAEVNVSLYHIVGSQEATVSEGYNAATQKVETRYDLNSPGNNQFRFGTENVGGSLYMAFYF